MANRIGTERSNYARLENRDINLTLKQIQEIAEALEVSVYEILGGPQTEEEKGEQAEALQRLEERLKMTENILKEKKNIIKFYKSFIVWTREKFQTQYVLSVIYAAIKLEIREIDIEENDELDPSLTTKYNFTEEEQRKIGDYLFSYEAPDTFLMTLLLPPAL